MPYLQTPHPAQPFRGCQQFVPFLALLLLVSLAGCTRQQQRVQLLREAVADTGEVWGRLVLDRRQHINPRNWQELEQWFVGEDLSLAITTVLKSDRPLETYKQLVVGLCADMKCNFVLMQTLFRSCVGVSGATFLVIEQNGTLYYRSDMDGVIQFPSVEAGALESLDLIQARALDSVIEIALTNDEATQLERGLKRLLGNLPSQAVDPGPRVPRGATGFGVVGIRARWNGEPLDAVLIDHDEYALEDRFRRSFPDWQDIGSYETNERLACLYHHLYKSWVRINERRMQVYLAQ